MKHIAEIIPEFATSCRDLAWLFIGKEIGHGMSRMVYQHFQDRNLIIKVETGNENFQNVIEWTIWQSVKDTPMAKWFAPCVDISPNGHFLIQKKAEKIPKSQYPKTLPAFFTDLKYDNFGMIEDKFVCIDYGTMNLVRNIFTKKMQKANWWEQ